MPKITFIESTGDEQVVDARCGDSVMEAAIANSIPGIVAECGGSCICATCHVIVAEEWTTRLSGIEDMEQGTLEGAVNPSSRSRLSCQLVVDESMDGLVLHTPESQF